MTSRFRFDATLRWPRAVRISNPTLFPSLPAGQPIAVRRPFFRTRLMHSAPYELSSRTQSSTLLSLIRDWRLFRNGALIGMLAAVAIVLGVGRSYTTTVSFLPQALHSGQLAGLAAQLGLDAASGNNSESPFFYVELFRTREVLSRVVAGRFDDGEESGDYAKFLGITATDSAIRTDKAIKALEKRLNVQADRRSGIVTIEVTEKNPRITFQLAAALLTEIARYNRESRQSRAASERRFVESRVAAARKEVSISEHSLQNFLTKNREYRSSLELTFQYDRLQRSVAQHASVVSSLAQNFEQSRIDEVRDTPVISVVQPPRLPARADPRGWFRALVGGSFGGLAFAVLLQLGIACIRRLRTESPGEYQSWLATLRTCVETCSVSKRAFGVFASACRPAQRDVMVRDLVKRNGSCNLPSDGRHRMVVSDRA